jgi:hypothetical protein
MKKSEGILHEFFAVTLSGSLYHISDEFVNGCPSVVKIARKGESRVDVGERLRSGQLVGLVGRKIVLYSEDAPLASSLKKQDPGEVSTYLWGGHTSPVVALFLREEDAMACFLDKTEKTALDNDWRDYTQAALERIGKNHPVFIISPSFLD